MRDGASRLRAENTSTFDPNSRTRSRIGIIAALCGLVLAPAALSGAPAPPAATYPALDAAAALYMHHPVALEPYCGPHRLLTSSNCLALNELAANPAAYESNWSLYVPYYGAPVFRLARQLERLSGVMPLAGVHHPTTKPRSQKMPPAGPGVACGPLEEVGTVGEDLGLQSDADIKALVDAAFAYAYWCPTGIPVTWHPVGP